MSYRSKAYEEELFDLGFRMDDESDERELWVNVQSDDRFIVSVADRCIRIWAPCGGGTIAYAFAGETAGGLRDAVKGVMGHGAGEGLREIVRWSK